MISAIASEKTKAALDELDQLSEEAREHGWDGHGAFPISTGSCAWARRLLEGLPPEIPNPTVSADPDGHVSLEWYRSPRHLLSVSVSPEGELHFAALFGKSRLHGVEPLEGALPKLITQLITRVLAG
jgi:hypothetical protein